MLRYKIIHQTYYNFSQPVQLLRHTLRILPKESHQCRVESFQLSVDPAIDVLWHSDVEGNSVAVAHYAHRSQYLKIESEAIIRQYNEKPFLFVIEDYAVNYPFSYTVDDSHILDPYRVLPPKETCREIALWIASFWQVEEAIQTYTLLERMCGVIYQTFAYTIREEAGVRNSQETLQLKTGSCRDFSWLFIEAARYLGFAARFVSGYLNSPPNSQNYGATHAWAEVYIPGAGWKGFDPTVGLLAGADNIAVAVAASANAVPPIAGQFQGNASSNMKVGVWVSRL